MTLSAYHIYTSIRESLYATYLTIRATKGQSREINSFERRFGDIIESKHTLSTSMARTGLYYSLKALELTKGDEVVMSSISIPEMLAVFKELGIVTKFVDNFPCSLRVDTESLREKISSKTKLCFITHVASELSDVSEISRICKEKNIYFIQDSTQFLNSHYNDSPLASYSDISIYSMSEFKYVSTHRGGMVCTSNNGLYSKIQKVIYKESTSRSLQYYLTKSLGVILLRIVFSTICSKVSLFFLKNNITSKSPLDSFSYSRKKNMSLYNDEMYEMRNGVPSYMKYRLGSSEAYLGTRSLNKLYEIQSIQNRNAHALKRELGKYIKQPSDVANIQYWRFGITFKTRQQCDNFCNVISGTFIPARSGLSYLGKSSECQFAQEAISNTIFIPIQYTISEYDFSSILVSTRYGLEKAYR